jgi:hypothetical protein
MLSEFGAILGFVYYVQEMLIFFLIYKISSSIVKHLIFDTILNQMLYSFEMYYIF